MQKRPLGASGLSITPLMLGGNVFGWTADQRASFAVLDAFVDLGGDAIDTADHYSSNVPGNVGGESERMLAAWFKQSGKRDRVMLATKVGLWPKRKGISAANIVAACEESLQRLGTDVIDLYQLHLDDGVTAPEEFMGALDGLVKAGKVRALGASNFEVSRLSQAQEAARTASLTTFATMQPEYSLTARGIEAELLPFCVSEQVSLLCYFPLAAGYLTGKYRSEADLAKNKRGGRAVDRVAKLMQGKGPGILAAMECVAAAHEASLAQVALAWVMSRPGVAVPIASATSAEQVADLMRALQLKLSAAELDELDRASV